MVPRRPSPLFTWESSSGCGMSESDDVSSVSSLFPLDQVFIRLLSNFYSLHSLSTAHHVLISPHLLFPYPFSQTPYECLTNTHASSFKAFLPSSRLSPDTSENRMCSIRRQGEFPNMYLIKLHTLTSYMLTVWIQLGRVKENAAKVEELTKWYILSPYSITSPDLAYQSCG